MKTLSSLASAISHKINGQKPINFKDYVDIMRKYNGIDWAKYSETDNNEMIVYQASEFSLWLKTWSPGQFSDYHVHPSQGCVTRVLTGRLTEYQYHYKHRLVYCGNTAFYSSAEMCHAIHNNDDRLVYTLHLYGREK